MRLKEMDGEQRRQFIDTEQIWEALDVARARVKGYAGTMTWKRVAGREYLVKVNGPAARRRTRSLGPRSPETEGMLRQFESGKEQAREAFRATAARLSDMARLNRALRLSRVPLPAAQVIRALHARDMLGRNLLVVGTHALYAYEASAGVFVDSDLLATGDIDVLFDARTVLRLGSNEEPASLLDVLKEVDPSYARIDRVPFRAVNARGFHVDLIKRTPHDVITSAERDAVGGADDLQAAHVANMRWVANAPKFKAMAIGTDGLPVPMACPDPRAFALYKLWMGTNDATREPIKRRRDVAQAHTVADIVREYFPHLPFEPQHLTSFPRRAAEAGMADGLFRLP